jgi:hypothetical protein
MDSFAMIDGYVDDVIRRLPRRQQRDVGLELRSLLSEELDAKAMQAGRAPDSDMTLALLRGFGAPQDVADRYRPGFLIIRPSEARTFVALSVGGVLLQWAVTLVAILAGQKSGTPDSPLAWIVGALWWPGILILIQIFVAWLRDRIGGEATTWIPNAALDRDRINRPLMILALAFWIIGAAALIALPWLGQILPHAPRPLIAAFAFDPSFWDRALFVLPLWAASFAVQTLVVIDGRWTARTRRIETVLSIAWILLLSWLVLGGPIFKQPQAEQTTKLMLGICVLVALGTVIVSLLRERRGMRTPATTRL